MNLAQGFFIAAFGDRCKFVHHALKEQARLKGANLEKLDAPSSDSLKWQASDNPLDLLARLSQKLTASDFVVVDLSPPDATGKFNPNVMFELGRALELKRPIYSICDARVLQTPGALPFDIASLQAITYELSPEGLDKLAESFAAWLDSGQHNRHILSHKHILDLVALRDQFTSWEESTLHRFSPVIDVVMRRLKQYANLIAQADDTQSGTVAFEPLRRQDMIEAVFCSTLSAMKEPDEYDTVSTLEFWREIEGDGATEHQHSIDSLLAATKTALDQGVNNRRLFLVPGWNLDPKRHEALIDGHENLRKNYPTRYTLGYYVVHEESSYLSLRRRLHVGVCRVPTQKVNFVLQPSYSLRKGSRDERLIALNYVLGTAQANKFALAINSLWESDGAQGARFANWADVVTFRQQMLRKTASPRLDKDEGI